VFKCFEKNLDFFTVMENFGYFRVGSNSMRQFQLLLIAFLAFALCVDGQPPSLINRGDTILYLPYRDGIATFSFKGKMGIIDSTGKVIVHATFSRLNRLFTNEEGFSYRFYYDGKKQGILDQDFNVLVPVGSYDDIDILIGGFFKVKKNGKYSFVNEQGKCFDKWFDNAEFFRSRLAPVKLNGKWGFINDKCDFVIPNTYSDAKTFSNDGLAAVKLNGKWGFIDLSGKTVIPLMYEKVNFFINGSCGVRKENMWGYIDRTNSIIIPFQYGDAEPFFTDLALVKKDGNYGFINIHNEVVIPFQFSKAFSFGENEQLAYVKLNGKWTHIDKKGNIQKMYWDK
jgi:hypothetical protein